MSEDTATLEFNTSTEAAVVAGLALSSTEPTELDLERVVSLVVPQGANHVILDLEDKLGNPHHRRGTVHLRDSESFVKIVDLYGEDKDTHIYADIDAYRFVAVFNDDGDGIAGWRDSRAELQLRKTPEWQHWENQDARLLPQQAFAFHLESGAAEIVEPDAATMVELAQTFLAKTSLNFKSSEMLDSGQRQFLYEETTSARAGQAGKIEVPKEFILGISPFEGTDPYKVTARLRFRINDGQLTIGYQLDRPHLMLRAAFNDTYTAIDEATTPILLSGTPANPRR